jgi:hypothetical protein
MIASIGENVESPYIAGGNVKRFSHFGKQCSSSSRDLMYDPKILLSGIYQEK